MEATADVEVVKRLEGLEQKLDRVLAELDEVRRIRREFEDLKEEVSRLGKGVFQSVVAELDGAAPLVQPGDFAALGSRLVRNVNTMTELLMHLESARDLLADATPVGRQLFGDAVAKLDELDRKGYFAISRELLRALDNVVANFTVEDVRMLADNLVAILQTVKNVTQPEMLQAINNAVEVYQKIDFSMMEEYSLWRALREANRPAMRRGLGFLIVFLRNLSAHTPGPRAIAAAPVKASTSTPS